MSLVVEDGTGRVDAESYASVADADSYWSLHGSPSSWSAASTSAKEGALRAAADYADRVYGGRFQGCRVYSTQRLAWPRAAVEVDGYTLPIAPLPRLLTEAAIELAGRHITETGGLTPDVADPSRVTAEAVEVGSVKQSVTYAGAKSAYKRFTAVELLLRPLLAAREVERS